MKESMEAAHAAGTMVSYDLNFRSKLWSSEKAIAVTKEIVPFIDVLIGNEEDFQKVLGFKVEGVDESLKKLPVEGYKRMVERVVEKYPHIKAVGTTLREVVSGLVNNWSAILYLEGSSMNPSVTRAWRSKTAWAAATVFAAAPSTRCCTA